MVRAAARDEESISATQEGMRRKVQVRGYRAYGANGRVPRRKAGATVGACLTLLVDYGFTPEMWVGCAVGYPSFFCLGS